MPGKRSFSVPWLYILSIVSAVLFTWIVHELAHWGVGTFLGNDMAITLNSSYSVTGHHNGRMHELMISAAGPAFTLLEGYVIYSTLKDEGDENLFPLLLTCAYMRVLAGFMNFINPNDEGRISKELGLGTFTIPVIVGLILCWWVFSVIKKRHYSARFVSGTFFLIMLFSSILILCDQFFMIRLI